MNQNPSLITSEMIQDGKKPNVLHQLYHTANPLGRWPVELPKQEEHPLLLRVSHGAEVTSCAGRRKLAAGSTCGSLWFLTLLHQGDQ